MFCKNCGNKLIDGSKFCGGCGKKTITEVNSVIEKNKDSESNDFVEVENETVIKCGNCEYIGKGQKARSTWAIILVWICVVFAPMVTIIYYLATSKYKCPKCKSTFLGIKNEEGKFVGRGSAGGRVALIFVCILLGIAFIGILSSVVLASLNSARSKGQDASIKSQLSSMRAQAELYWSSQSTNGKDGNYAGLCNDTIVTEMKNSINTTKTVDIVCKDNYERYAISAPINSGGYWCVDSSGFSGQISQSINSATCSLSDSINTNTGNTPVLSGAELCANAIKNSTWDGKSYLSDGKYQCSCKLGYEQNLAGDKCLTPNQNCNEQIPYSHDIGNNTCGCNTNYTLSDNGKYCY